MQKRTYGKIKTSVSIPVDDDIFERVSKIKNEQYDFNEEARKLLAELVVRFEQVMESGKAV